jgi:hypothetical protein
MIVCCAMIKKGTRTGSGYIYSPPLICIFCCTGCNVKNIESRNHRVFHAMDNMSLYSKPSVKSPQSGTLDTHQKYIEAKDSRLYAARTSKRIWELDHSTSG